MKISIAILTFNRVDTLKQLLLSLRELTYSQLEVIVVDNNSGDGTESLVKDEFPTFSYFRMDSNRGVAARNVGVKKATGEIVITLDDDIVGINNESFLKLISLFDQKPEVGAICFSVRNYYTGEICNWSHHFKKEVYFNKEFITDELTEGAVAFRKSVFEKCNGYPEDFFISHEGPDLVCRMLNNGYKTIYSPEICVKHLVAKEGRPGWRRYYFDTRNQIWFVARNYPLFWCVTYLAKGLTAMGIYSIRDGYSSYWVKGIFDGIRGLKKALKSRTCISKTTRTHLLEIKKYNPGIIYMIKQRLLKRGVSI